MMHDIFTEHVIQTKLVSLFSRFGQLRWVSLLFDRVELKIDELYHSMLKGHAKNSILEDGLLFFAQMRLADVRPVVYNFTYLLKTCGDNVELRRGKELYSQLIAHGFGSNVFAMTAFVNMYAKCRQIEDAQRMFDRMPERDLVAWNAIIFGYAQNDLAKRALEFVFMMQREGKRLDSITLVSVLPASLLTVCTDCLLNSISLISHTFEAKSL